jgi:arylamine N-acetyltransferase
MEEGRVAGGEALCTMNNGFFGAAMRSLGFRVKMAAARVAKANRVGPKGVFDGWNHLINLVEIEGRRYLVDVGFGANGELF